MSAALKKVFYNRVRRTCRKHDIDIQLEGAPKNYRSVQLLLGDYAQGREPLNIDWQRLHDELTKYGFVGGIK
jgi:hypothetical protein